MASNNNSMTQADGGAAGVTMNVTQKSLLAWGNYEPMHDAVGDQSLAYIVGVMRHAFLCGYAAAERDQGGAK